jgi:hypothetical protein
MNYHREPPPPLFAPHNGTPTSKAAAVAIQPSAATLRAKVLEAIRAAPAGLTDEEGQAATGLRVQTYTPRRGELVKQGLIEDSGSTRATSSGRKAVVWVEKKSSNL